MKVEPAPYSLSWYTRLASGLSVGQLQYAVRDIQATLPIYRERDTRDPYVAKLLAEMDAFTSEMTLRKRKGNRS
jgi:hypothetical protein